ncbi:MAG: amidase domain-containing protein [Oscillospiraceae bacterium]|jgi:hypothetical protein
MKTKRCIRYIRMGLMIGLMTALFPVYAWAREENSRNTWVLASPGRQEQIQTVAEGFLERRALMEWMYQEEDLTPYLLDGGTSEHLRFFLNRTELFKDFRKENGVRRENFNVRYTFGKVSYQATDGTYFANVTEEVTYHILDAPDDAMETYIATEFQVVFKETEKGFRVADVYDPEDWFTAEYEDKEVDCDALLKDYTGDARVAAKTVSEPVQEERPRMQDMSDTALPSTGAYRVNTYRPYRPMDAIYYAYTYSANDGNQNMYYNPHFYWHSQADCINFGSQCVWAGLSGSNDAVSIQSHAAPMDAGGSWQWYGREASDSNVSYITWRSNTYFNRYMEHMNAVDNKESGVLSKIIELSVEEGSGNGVLDVEPFGLLGAVMQVKGGSTEYGHAIFIVGINPTKDTFTRNNIYFCSHTSNRRNACLGDWFPNCQIRVFEPQLYREVSYCTNPEHTYSRVAGGADATCNECGYVRLFIDPYMIKPVTKGTRSTIGGTANIACSVMKITVKTPSGKSAVVNTTSNQRICRCSYTFQESGLYEITISGTDRSNAYQDKVTRSVTYTVRVT